MAGGVIYNMQPNIIPAKPYGCAFCGVSLETSTCSFPVPFRLKHTVLWWPAAKVRLSEAGEVRIRVNLRTGLVGRQ